jgi:hypothetical protein
MPFRITNLGYGLFAAENEQDTLDDIGACVELSVRTPRGFIDSAPELGVTEQTFHLIDVDVDQLKWEIVKDEPRVELESELIPSSDELIENILLKVGGSPVAGGQGV